MICGKNEHGEDVLVIITYDKDGNILKRESSNRSCELLECPDNKKYCDPRAQHINHSTGEVSQDKGYWVHKYTKPGEVKNINGECNYIFEVTAEKCSLEEAGNIKEDQSINPVRVQKETEDFLTCEPNSWDIGSCSRCNSAGTAYLPEGSDWGPNETNLEKTFWCSCAGRYHGRYNTARGFTKENYPQCVHN